MQELRVERLSIRRTLRLVFTHLVRLFPLIVLGGVVLYLPFRLIENLIEGDTLTGLLRGDIEHKRLFFYFFLSLLPLSQIGWAWWKAFGSLALDRSLKGTNPRTEDLITALGKVL